MQVNPATSKHVLEHEGTRYAFCCGGCLAKFKADPKQYLVKAATKPVAKPAGCCGGHGHGHAHAALLLPLPYLARDTPAQCIRK